VQRCGEEGEGQEQQDGPSLGPLIKSTVVNSGL